MVKIEGAGFVEWDVAGRIEFERHVPDQEGGVSRSISRFANLGG